MTQFSFATSLILKTLLCFKGFSDGNSWHLRFRWSGDAPSELLRKFRNYEIWKVPAQLEKEKARPFPVLPTRLCLNLINVTFLCHFCESLSTDWFLHPLNPFNHNVFFKWEKLQTSFFQYLNTLKLLDPKLACMVCIFLLMLLVELCFKKLSLYLNNSLIYHNLS